MVTEKMIEAATMPCGCTKIAQDEACPVGYPSLLCEVCGGKGHVPYVKLDGPELWEIVFGVNDDAATEITDAQFDQIAKGINDVFVEPLRTQAALSTDAEPVAFVSPGTFALLQAEFGGLFQMKPEKWKTEETTVPLYAAPVAPSVAVKDLLDSVWNAAVEQAAAIANDCVHLTPDPGAAIKTMLNSRGKLHPSSSAALSAQVQDVP